jgi:hypothetical protein
MSLQNLMNVEYGWWISILKRKRKHMHLFALFINLLKNMHYICYIEGVQHTSCSHVGNYCCYIKRRNNHSIMCLCCTSLPKPVFDSTCSCRNQCYQNQTDRPQKPESNRNQEKNGSKNQSLKIHKIFKF